MSTIDIHAHAFPDPIAERAIARLEAECPWKAFAAGKVSELLASMDAAGVDVSVVCPIATKPDQAVGILCWCDAIRSERIEPFPSIHPDTPGAGQWIRRIADGGYRGIKLHPMYQQFAIDEPRLEAIYAAAVDGGLAVEFHCGRDIAFPPDDDRAAPARTARVLDRFGGLKVVCTHMGGWRMWDESDEQLIGRDVWMETSFSLEALGPERAGAMIRRHGVDRVLFGSDWPWARQGSDLTILAGVGLDADELAKVRGLNAAKLLGRTAG